MICIAILHRTVIALRKYESFRVHCTALQCTITVVVDFIPNQQIGKGGCILNKKRKALATISLLMIILIIGIPIFINESYKIGGYITKWGAADVLSYYGTVLGSLISVAVLAATIQFTRKQIQYDQFVKDLSEKWNNIDSIIVNAIEAVQPLQVSQMVYADVGYEHAGETINKLQCHIMEMKMSLDMLNCHLAPTEGERLNSLIEQILQCMDSVELLANQMIQQLSCLQKNKLHESYKELLRLASQSPDMTDENTLQSYRSGLRENPYTPPDQITQEIGSIGVKLVNLYNTTYRALLSKKREVFSIIEKENTERAATILNWF